MDQYRSLKDHVYDYIAKMIDAGEMGGGDKVSENGICEALGVSRTPVREALIQLAGDGYLDYTPRKGFRVQHVSEENAREIFEIIGPLDGRAAYLACNHLTDEDCAKLQFLQESMDLAIEKGLLKTYNELQHEFHDLYTERCDNPRLIAYIKQLNRFFMGREYVGSVGDEARAALKRANAEHAEIVRLLKLRDRVRVQRYIRDVHWNIENAKFAAW